MEANLCQNLPYLPSTVLGIGVDTHKKAPSPSPTDTRPHPSCQDSSWADVGSICGEDEAYRWDLESGAKEYFLWAGQC